jgi:hypothetical protein
MRLSSRGSQGNHFAKGQKTDIKSNTVSLSPSKKMLVTTSLSTTSDPCASSGACLNWKEGCHESNSINFFLRRYKCNSNEIYLHDSYMFFNYEATFVRSLRFFHTVFVNFELNAVYRCCKIPCLAFSAYHGNLVQYIVISKMEFIY